MVTGSRFDVIERIGQLIGLGGGDMLDMLLPCRHADRIRQAKAEHQAKS
jgi:hypothetical protein